MASRYARFFPAELRDEPDREVLRLGDIELSVLGNRVPPSGLTCVVLHGGGGNAELVAPIVTALGLEGIRALAPDLPGYGRSEVEPRRFRYPTWIETVGELARREREHGSVALFGLSMGGMLAIHVAAAQPRAIDGVAATNLLDIGDPAVRRVAVRQPWMAPLTSLLMPWLDPVRVPMRWMANMRAIANDPAFAEACATDPRGGGLSVPLGFLRSWIDYRPEIAPEQLEVPVLLAHPGDDRWTPTATSMPFFERLHGPKRFVELENCGHAPVEEPGITVLREELTGFLGELGEGSAGHRAHARVNPSRS